MALRQRALTQVCLGPLSRSHDVVTEK